MRFEVLIAGRKREVELERASGKWRARLDGRAVDADAVEVAPGAYSILLDGRSFDVRVQAAADGVRVHTGAQEFAAQVLDPRAWRGRRGGVLELEGRQQIVAPMPGKIVRVLVKTGDAVKANQGLLVVEAMKMQNEIRAPKSGKVERVRVSEGQTVNAGEVLVVVA